MSEVKVNKISPRTACGTVTLGERGDTFTIPSGATITNAGTASGFGATGETSWDTTVKTTGTFTATAGVGYFLNTTGGIITVNLPAGTAGDSVALADYAGTWQTNNVTVSPNGSEKMGGIAADITLSTEGQSVTFVYIDGTQGWVNVLDSTSNVRGATFIVATGGTPACGLTSGDYKYHTFTGPGTFCVSAIGNTPACNVVDYLVVAGGGSGGTDNAGGGGAGGFRLSNGTGMSAPLTSPLATPTAITVTASPYPIVVGAGGAAVPGPAAPGNVGNPASFSTITSAAGSGGRKSNGGAADDGGSAGGGSGTGTGGSGNTPPVSPPQGNDGGDGYDGTALSTNGGGGGGAGAAGSTAGPFQGGDGGIGSFVLQTGFAGCNGTPGPTPSTRYFAGGGGGSTQPSGTPPATGGTGGAGGGGTGGGLNSVTTDGGVNTGGGGGGGTPETPGPAPESPGTSGGGGSGIVILRYKYQ